MARLSKKTLAHLAQYPTLADWVIKSLSVEQLQALMQAPCGMVSFEEGHPLNSQSLGVQLWRAHRRQVVFELECLWGEDEDYSKAPRGPERNEYFHAAVCFAIGNYAREQSELMQGVIERQRCEIAEVSATPAPSHSDSRLRL